MTPTLTPNLELRCYGPEHVCIFRYKPSTLHIAISTACRWYAKDWLTVDGTQGAVRTMIESVDDLERELCGRS